MNAEKANEIAEIAKIICENSSQECCVDCEFLPECNVVEVAEQIYNAGYRRADDNEWKKRAEVAESKLFDLAMLCVKADRNFYNKGEQVQSEEAKQLMTSWLKEKEQDLQEGKGNE